MSVGTQSVSSSVLNTLTSIQQKTNKLQTELTTNKNILDPAQQGIVTRLTSQVNGFEAAQTNMSKYQNVLSVTQTGLSSISALLTQMQSIANSSNDPSVTSATAATNQKTLAALIVQIAQLSSSSQIDGVGLLASSSVDLDVQTGLTTADKTTLTAVPSDTTSLGIASLDVSTQAGAAAAITALATALGKISASQSSVASNQLALTNTAALDASISQSLTSTIDAIQKPNAAEIQQQLSDLSTANSINLWALNQINTQASSVLSLFR